MRKIKEEKRMAWSMKRKSRLFFFLGISLIVGLGQLSAEQMTMEAMKPASVDLPYCSDPPQASDLGSIGCQTVSGAYIPPVQGHCSSGVSPCLDDSGTLMVKTNESGNVLLTMNVSPQTVAGLSEATAGITPITSSTRSTSSSAVNTTSTGGSTSTSTASGTSSTGNSVLTTSALSSTAGTSTELTNSLNSNTTTFSTSSTTDSTNTGTTGTGNSTYSNTDTETNNIAGDGGGGGEDPCALEPWLCEPPPEDEGDGGGGGEGNDQATVSCGTSAGDQSLGSSSQSVDTSNVGQQQLNFGGQQITGTCQPGQAEFKQTVTVTCTVDGQNFGSSVNITAPCPKCGDGKVNGGEACDGGDDCKEDCTFKTCKDYGEAETCEKCGILVEHKRKPSACTAITSSNTTDSEGGNNDNVLKCYQCVGASFKNCSCSGGGNSEEKKDSFNGCYKEEECKETCDNEKAVFVGTPGTQTVYCGCPACPEPKNPKEDCQDICGPNCSCTPPDTCDKSESTSSSTSSSS